MVSMIRRRSITFAARQRANEFQILFIPHGRLFRLWLHSARIIPMSVAHVKPFADYGRYLKARRGSP